MPIGALNPTDLTHSTSVKPPYVLNAINQRRYYSDNLNTIISQQDFIQVVEQIRYALDSYGIPDVEGDDTLLKQAIDAGAANLSGNLLLFQNLIGSADKAPYFTGGSSMDLMVVTAYSRSLFAKTNSAQWRDALGISAALSGNVIAFGNLASAADLLPYFTGVETMAMCAFKAWGRGLVGQLDAPNARTYLGLGTASTYDATYFLTSADLASYAPLASPAFTGSPTAPTQVAGNNTTRLATTAFVRGELGSYLTTASAAGIYAPLISPAFSGSPTGPTQAPGNNTTRLATTAFVQTELASYATGGDLAAYAPLASPAFTGTPTAPTPVTSDNSTKLSTTAYVKANLVSYAPLASPVFTGAPTGPTPTAGDSSLKLATTGFVAASFAPLVSPALSGTPTAPTPVTTDNSTKLSTTAYVKANLVNYAALTGAAFTGAVFADSFTANAGSLIVDRTGTGANSTIQIRADVANLRDFSYYTGTSLRWTLRAGATAESGGNVGSGFQMIAYDDSGVSLGNVFTITRATRIVDFSISPTAPTPAPGDSSTKLATTGFISTAISNAAANYVAIAGAVMTGLLVLSADPSASLGAATKQYVDDGLALKASLTGATFTSGISIDKTGVGGNLAYTLNNDAGSIRFLNVLTGGSTRWQLRLADATAESGANAGSNQSLIAYDDTGVTIGTVYSINRASRIFNFNLSPTAPTPATADSSTSLATTAYVKANLVSYAPLVSPTFTAGATFGGNVTLSRAAGNMSLFIDGPAATNRWLQFQTGGLNRWIVRGADAALESGSNAGSNFVLWAYDDAGASLGSVFNANRATQVVNFTQIPTAPTPATADSSTALATTAHVKANLASYAPLASPTFTGVSLFPDGASVNAPSIAFASEITLGIYKKATGQMAFAGGTVQVDRTGASAAAQFALNRDAGQLGVLSYMTGGSTRWRVLVNASLESGANVGSDFTIQSFDDAGASIGNVLVITRATRLVNFSISPTAPTPVTADSSTSLATTAYVKNQAYAPLASPAFTGTPTAPTAAALDSSTKIASTSYVDNADNHYPSIPNASAASPIMTTTWFGALVRLNSASAQTMALPDDATLAVPLGTWIDFAQWGAGQTTFSAGGTASVFVQPTIAGVAVGLKTIRYGIIRAVKIIANTWILSGAGLTA
jgi:hypothetical protein